MKVVLALHGFLGVPDDWLEVQQEFVRLQDSSSFVQFEAVDYMNLRGLTPDVGFDRWGDNFCLWAEKQFPKHKKIILGYSLGGRLALHALKAKPKLWNTGVLCSSHAGLDSEEERRLRRDSDQRWAQRFQNADFDSVVKEWNAQAVFNQSRQEPLRKSCNYDSGLLSRALQQWSLGRQQGLSHEIQNWGVPLRWLAGEQDKKYVTLLEQILNSSGLIEKEIILQASHRVLFDQPRCLARSIYEMTRKAN